MLSISASSGRTESSAPTTVYRIHCVYCAARCGHRALRTNTVPLIYRKGNGLPRQSADWLAMTGFFRQTESGAAYTAPLFCGHVSFSRKSLRYWEGVTPSAFLKALVNTR